MHSAAQRANHSMNDWPVGPVLLLSVHFPLGVAQGWVNLAPSELFNPAAAEDAIAVVADGGLSGCNAERRLVEADVETVVG